MKRKIIAGLLLILVFSVTNSIQVLAIENDSITNSSVISINKIKENLSLDETIKKQANLLIEGYDTTSIQYAVVDSGKIILSDNAGENGKISKNTMYGIGSISKMFVTASVMKLVDENKIDLDKPVVNYILDFKMQDERYKQITPRMLINHSSGIMGTTSKDTFLFDDNDTTGYDQLLSELSNQRLKANPGEYSVYCNDGFTLAQLLVERVSGTDFTTYIHENFTKPLNITNTKTPLNSFDKRSLAKVYDNNLNKKELPNESVNIIGTGGIYSTAEDLCEFSRIFTDRDINILSKESIDSMSEKEYAKGIHIKAEDNMIGYGLGWDSVDSFPFNRYGIKALTKGGDTLAYHGSIICLPQYDLSVAVVSSGGASGYDQAFGTSVLLKILKEKGIISEMLPDVTLPNAETTNMPKEFTKYSGLYNISNTMAKVDINCNGTLTFNLIGDSKDNEQVYTYTNDGYFTLADGRCKCNFVEEKNGIIYLVRKMYMSLEGLSQGVIWDYNLQKVEVNPISDDLKSVWKLRNNKDYYVLNEKYTSEKYMKFLNAIHMSFKDEDQGYFMGHKIVSENEAKSITKIPGNGGRDLFDFKFYKENGIEYLKFGSSIAIASDAIPKLSNDLTKVTIGEDGYAKWYTVPPEMAGKNININSSKNSAFAVYDANGKCINYSYISGEDTVLLDNGYRIVFMGDKDEIFNIDFK
ncbi:serine hydrolase domain-containing protein [Clostridium sp. ZBS15]|uniref:serine hydrolase domain-containing protein n=1 Tax=Clostridium sp. ZBS15 TaxID=2949969 RepID=UPI00207AC168|nr:serine hydrolase domain-containing protein [Clostridium sp. ZBS15]